ncbi:transport and Golgi organization protein 1 homolog isoform X2 [Lynx rufus]|uniref:transport and Golgi organization protein 1 homolog isoform X2 n=1 Tax=Lynx rufus TaxID=61384 RepID=UPI001F125EDB|nr:transport and Golgi organization protein 1 homolog isoform X2 [Lynx rufus]
MNCELAAVKNQMATAEENLKIATEEIHKYKQQIEQRREQLQRAELTFRHQIAVYEKTAQHNWIKTQIWERAMAEERREAAHLKHRLDMMEGKRPLEGYMRQKPMPGRPQTQNPPRREPLADPETGVAPVSHNDKHSTKNAEKDKGSVDPWGPPLLTGRFCTPYPRGPPMGYRACPPPEPWWPWGPPRTSLPTPRGQEPLLFYICRHVRTLVYPHSIHYPLQKLPLCMQEGLVLSQDGLAGPTTWTTLHHQPRAVGHLPLLHQLLHLLHLDNLNFEEDPKL